MATPDDLVLRELTDMRMQVTALVALYKAVNYDAVEKLKRDALKSEARRKVYDLCDGERTVAEIAQLVEPDKPVETSKKVISYHLIELEGKGMLAHRDEGRNRYYFRLLE
jgi:DNA-binding transcriptional ArsR family regulator